MGGPDAHHGGGRRWKGGDGGELDPRRKVGLGHQRMVQLEFVETFKMKSHFLSPSNALSILTFSHILLSAIPTASSTWRTSTTQ